MHPKIAALDLGSNSFHLAIAECHAARRFSIAARWKEKVQLGQSVFASGRIGEADFARGLEALRKLRRMLDTQRPDVTLAVATSALREADDGREFVAHASSILGAPVRLISGDEEARLMGLGTVQSLAVQAPRLAIFDLGGGSTEVVVMDRQRTALTASLPLGTLRLAGSWACAPRPSRAERTWLERHVASLLAATVQRVSAAHVDTLVFSCGSARDLARLARQLGPAPSPNQRPTLLTKADVVDMEERLVSLAPAERAALLASDPRRADTLLVAAIVFKTLFSALRMEQACVSSAGLREGMVADHLAANHEARSALMVAL